MNRREFFKGSAWVFALAALAPVVEKGGVARHHLAATMRGDEVVFYLDGEVVLEEALRGNRPMQWIHGGVVWDCMLGKSDMRWLAAGIDPAQVYPSGIVAETPFSAPFYPFARAVDFDGNAMSEVTFSLFAGDKHPSSIKEFFPRYRQVNWVYRDYCGRFVKNGYWLKGCRQWVSDGCGLNDKIDTAVFSGVNLCEGCVGNGCLLQRRA